VTPVLVLVSSAANAAFGLPTKAKDDDVTIVTDKAVTATLRSKLFND
jgi:hypothetical protein